MSDDRSFDAKEEVIQQILKRMEQTLRQELVIGPQTLDQIEEQSQIIGEALKREIEQKIIDQAGTGYAGPSVLCKHGHSARFAGVRSRHLITRSGCMHVARAYYHCAQCRHGFCPLDQTLDLGSGQCSRRVVALMARFCSYLPYRTAVQELECICGVSLAVRTVERYVRKVGQRIEADWEALVQERDPDRWPASSEYPTRLHVTMDGVMIHVDGSWHEVKLGCAYQTRKRRTLRPGNRDNAPEATQLRYCATLTDSRLFGRRLQALAHRSGSDHCRDVAVVADGAEWIWQETGKYFPRSVQILDYYHVLEHLWKMAHARYGEGSSAAKEWIDAQEEALFANQVSAVIDTVERWHPRRKEKRELRDRLLGYLRTHEKRLAYKTFSEQGYHIGSGVAESGCKNVVQKRLKGAGMRWSREGAQAVLQLVSHWSSAGQAGFYPYTAN